ncbi:MAG: hypothetical protein L0L69_00505 [Propionibacterium sp.]|nr:hypothetical protein [Propionibacterium sp.]MDN6793541.1 hypothetical protein [Propionibacterium sp.]
MSENHAPEPAASRGTVPDPASSTSDRGSGASDIVLEDSLHAAVGGLRRILVGAGTVVVVAEVAWGLLAPTRPLTSALVAVLASLVLFVITWLTVSRAAAAPLTVVAWIAGGYLAKVAVVAGAVLGARAADLDARLVGIAVVVSVVVTVGCEMWVLLRVRVAPVTPRTD